MDSDLTTTNNDAAGGEHDRTDVINAINQMFAEFQLVYNNQYHKAFPTTDKLEYAKRLWYSFLKDYSAEQILAACHMAIKSSEFLPTVRGILKYLENDLASYGLPEVRDAYIEACQAGTPKAACAWSHPAVYHAGRASDWFLLASQPEHKALPVFEQHYRVYCDRVIKGEALALPEVEALPEEIESSMTREERQAALDKLRQETGLN
jgi:hypothetical protein